MPLECVVAKAAQSGGCHPPVGTIVFDDPAANEVRTLNGLIVGLLDNVDEYRRAIFAVEQRLNTLQRQLFNRIQATEQLQGYVRSIGAQPATTGSTLGTAFAALLASQRPLLTTEEHERELLRDAERGDRSLKGQLQSCVQGDRLSEQGRRCVSEVLDTLAADAGQGLWNAQSIVGTNALRSMLSNNLGTPNS